MLLRNSSLRRRVAPWALVSVVLASGLAVPAPASATPTPWTMAAGGRMVAGDQMRDEYSYFTLTMQTDGNLVERRSDTTAVWSSGTAGSPGAYFDLQPDGNLVVRASTGRTLWTSATPGHPHATLLLTLAGTLELSAPDVSKPYWTNGVGVLPPRTSLGPGQTLRTSDVVGAITSPQETVALRMEASYLLLVDNRFYETSIWLRYAPWQTALTMQTDGNLVLRNVDGSAAWSTGTRGVGNRLTVQDDGNMVVRRADGSAAWASGTTRISLVSGETAPPGTRFVSHPSVSGRPASTTTMQTDGNLVQRTPNGRVVWTTHSSGNPGARLTMRTDGNLVITRPDGRIVWQSGTNGCGRTTAFDVPHGWLVRYNADTIWTVTGGRQAAC